MKRILFISGSLRKDSFNKAILRKASEMLSDSFECVFLDYRDLPLLDQDAEYPAPEAVKRARDEVSAADLLWIGSPEYNHSCSAALKNLLDWLSRPVVPGDYKTAAGRGKLAALSSAAGSSGGSFSLAKLRELLSMLSCKVIDEETRIVLGNRFGRKELDFSEDEIEMIRAECNAIRKLLSSDSPQL